MSLHLNPSGKHLSLHLKPLDPKYRPLAPSGTKFPQPHTLKVGIAETRNLSCLDRRCVRTMRGPLSISRRRTSTTLSTRQPHITMGNSSERSVSHSFIPCHAALNSSPSIPLPPSLPLPLPLPLPLSSHLNSAIILSFPFFLSPDPTSSNFPHADQRR